MEMKVEGLLDAYTNLENPDFARVAQAIGFNAQRLERAEDLDAAVRDWLAVSGPGLLDVGPAVWSSSCPRKLSSPTPLARPSIQPRRSVAAARAMCGSVCPPTCPRHWTCSPREGGKRPRTRI